MEQPKSIDKEDTIMASTSNDDLNSLTMVASSAPSIYQEDKKICPMPNCKNEVRRGRYCNSCQKRKESLSRNMAQQGIHLNAHRKMKASTSSENLNNVIAQSSSQRMTLPPPVPTPVRGKTGNWDPSSLLIETNKKHRSSEDLFKAVQLPHASEILNAGTGREDMDAMEIYSPSPVVTRNRSATIPQESPRMPRFVSSTVVPESFLKKEENVLSREQKLMSINSLLSPSSPGIQRQHSYPNQMTFQTPHHFSTFQTTPIQSVSEEERQKMNERMMGEMIFKIDSMFLDLAGNDQQQATKLLKKYLTSNIGKARLEGVYSNP